MKQIDLIPSGCNNDRAHSVCTSDDRFVYFSGTLAIYLINRTTYDIEKILSSSERPVRDITASKHGNNLMATSSIDGTLTCWNVENEEIYCQTLPPASGERYMLDWDPFEPYRILMTSTHIENGNGTQEQLLKCQEWVVSDDGKGSITRYFDVPNGGSGTVGRWNPKKMNEFAVGSTSGIVTLFSSETKDHHFLKPPSNSAVVDLQWDKLSSIYLLVAYSNYISLWDAENAAEMHVFENQGAKITSIGWLDWTAGNFVSTNALTGALKVWNASQKAPLETIRVSNVGILHTHTIHGTHNILMGSTDGNFRVYNMMRRLSEHEVGAGHIETVFDCSFSNNNPDLFGSCSFDGTVKLWNASDGSLVKSIPITGDKSPCLYKLAFHQSDNYIAAASFSGKIYLIDREAGRVVCYFDHHRPSAMAPSSSFCVAWSPNEPDLLCSTSLDCKAVIFRVKVDEIGTASLGTGSRKQSGAAKAQTDAVATLKHPGAVFGCAWCPNHADLIATGSMDGKGRVWSYKTNTIIYVLTGHESRIFNITWSQACPGVLATSSDDKTARVWKVDVHIHNSDLTSKSNAVVSSFQTLRGHTNHVRGLSFNSEIRDLLMTGSWDATIRAWNYRTGKCLEVSHAHVADVYAIVQHRRRPFVYVSCSRDTTMRLWELEGVVRKIRAQVVAQLSFDNLKHGDNDSKDENNKISNADEEENTALASSAAVVKTDSPILARVCGAESEALGVELMKRKDLHDADPTVPSLALTYAYAAIFNFFCGANGASELWAVTIKHVKGLLTNPETGKITGPRVRPFGSKTEARRVTHEADILSRARGEAKKMESVRMNSGRKMEYSGKAAESLARAAYEYAKFGDFTEYCRIMLDLGRWKDALALAPAVSMEYWTKLSLEYAEKMASGASEEYVPYLVGAGDTNAAVQSLFDRDEIEAAIVVAKGAEIQPDNPPNPRLQPVTASQRSTESLSWSQVGEEGGGGSRTPVKQRQDHGDDGARGRTPSRPSDLLPLPASTPGKLRLNPLDGPTDLAASPVPKPRTGSRSPVPRGGRRASRDEVRQRRASMLEAAAKHAAKLSAAGEPMLAAAQLVAVGHVLPAARTLAAAGETDMAFALLRATGKCLSGESKEETSGASELRALLEGMAGMLVSAGDLASAQRMVKEAAMGTGQEESVSIQCHMALLIRRHTRNIDAKTGASGSTDEDVVGHALEAAGLRRQAWWAGRAKEDLAVGATVAGLRCLAAAGSDYAEEAARAGLKEVVSSLRDPLTVSTEVKGILYAVQFVEAHVLGEALRQTFLCTVMWHNAHDSVQSGDWETGRLMLGRIHAAVVQGARFGLSAVEIRVQQLFFTVAGADQHLAATSVHEALQWTELQEEQRDSLTQMHEALTARVHVPTPGSSRTQAGLRLRWGSAFTVVREQMARICLGMSLPSLDSVIESQLDITGWVANTCTVSGCGSRLPTPNQTVKRAVSILSAKKLFARGRLLDDGKSVVSMNEYLAWKRVCAFSPTMTGHFI